MKKTNSNGFSLLLIILIITLVGVVGFAGWRVFQTRSAKDQAPATSTSTSTVKKTKFGLAGNTVSFTAPKTWTKDSSVGCEKQAPAFASQQYLDSAAYIPGEKLKSTDGTNEFFVVRVCVFSNPNNLKPEAWYSTDDKGILMGIADARDTSTNKTIKGNAVYYRKHITDSYQDVNYVLSSGGKIVYISARTYETNTSTNQTGDFRKFETAINNMANSVTIN